MYCRPSLSAGPTNYGSSDIWKNFQKIPASKTWICHSGKHLHNIYMVIILYNYFVLYCIILYNLHCIRYYKQFAAAAAAAAKSLQSCLTLWDPIDGSPPGFPVPGILQARTLEWVTISFSNACKWKVKVKSLQSCPTLCDPIDGSPPGSSVPGILQARTLERVAISFSNAWKWKVKAKLFSHVRLLVTPMDCSLPGSSVHGIFQARVPEWGAIAFSNKQSRDD